ncbi:zinc-ribbon and DUF3426 domain-containing protein [Parendozoicomonas haliclonae]|uniref:Zinc finger/thioredoxin putative domain-containing protein n=1 Tax=Parendozoicomonas haliclonae TaxID=1960125 RepID=A0A1X7AFI8_9GAMM|nr:zinc-ribbon and DUF3426 domain-containing protein [Parendozoicomonas haliclonae]SMA36071.1 hypothetical protein EHSB41UT_00592 [Parendozoicomonas haliclonae]
MQATHQNRNTADSWITRCPECNTAFRITRGHLQAAKGSVRCGSCLYVFRADQHIVGGSLPEDLIPAPRPSQSVDFPEDDTDDDVLFSVSSEGKSQKDAEESLDLSDDVFAIEQAPKRHFSSNNETPAPQGDDDEAWARAMLDELDLEEEEQAAPEIQKVEPEFSAFDVDEAPAEPEVRHQAPADSLTGLDDDPLDLHYQKKSFLQRAAIPFCCLLLTIGLVAQHIIYNFDNIACTPSLRPLISTLCGVTGCQLPEMKDLSRVSVRNIVVRNEPTYQNAITVDAIISNEAAFPQPYPNLMMVISGVNNNVLGTRLLTPEQYLSGEAAGETDMQPMKPVHLSLNIMSPGPDARNITFDFP